MNFYSRNMIRFLLMLAVVLYVSQASSLLAEEWSNFKSTHGKQYVSAAEERMRQAIYLDNKRIVEEHNARYQKRLTTYTMALNQFADMSTHEFTQGANRFNYTLNRHALSTSRSATFSKTRKFIPPPQMDWRLKGAVSDVHDQGKCGACWAFSTTGVLEGQVYIKTSTLEPLSAQYLVDCSNRFGNSGCEGGNMFAAYNCIRDNGGINPESFYEYKGKEGTCDIKIYKLEAEVSGYVQIDEGDEDALLEAVTTVGPISVAVDSSQPSFQLYSSGVYYEPDCNSTKLDHAMLIVGYGTEDDQDYWEVKNSLGLQWGDRGYIKMARGRDNNCGIANFASYPILKE